MQFTALVALAIVASSVLGSSVLAAPAPPFHSWVIPKRDSGEFFLKSIGQGDQHQHRNSEISISRALDSVNTKRDDDSTFHEVLTTKRSMGDVITGPAVAHDNDSNSQEEASMLVSFYAKRDECFTCLSNTPY
ncbi:hypothetical protein EDD22DRAFT_397960 [Suillus occidentalis]|nr:hypothetical protein EDD22DRAFT_397960 [Suillus occidentalis]